MNYPKPIYIASARRTAIGRFGGGLKTRSPLELALPVAQAVVSDGLRASIDQVIMGQVLQVGSGMNVARQLGLALGAPQTAPAFTVNMVCASGLKSIMLGADAVALGAASLVLAGGVENMSRVPHYSTDLRWGRKLGNGEMADAIFTDGLTDPQLKISMGETAERIADRLAISREAQDEFAALSQQRAAAAKTGFQREIVSVNTPDGEIAADEHPRADTTRGKLAMLKPAFRVDGTVTAGNSSGLNDGAALVLVADEAGLRRHSLSARARIVAATAVGCDPAMMGLDRWRRSGKCAPRRVGGSTRWMQLKSTKRLPPKCSVARASSPSMWGNSTGAAARLRSVIRSDAAARASSSPSCTSWKIWISVAGSPRSVSVAEWVWRLRSSVRFRKTPLRWCDRVRW